MMGILRTWRRMKSRNMLNFTKKRRKSEAEKAVTFADVLGIGLEPYSYLILKLLQRQGGFT